MGTALLVSGIGGMIPGAIGAAVADSSRSHPILKGALVTGAANALLTLVFLAGMDSRQGQGQLSGANPTPLPMRFP